MRVQSKIHQSPESFLAKAQDSMGVQSRTNPGTWSNTAETQLVSLKVNLRNGNRTS